ncbi:MAG: hypothetical protein KDE45_06335, partial [Caldilineaceae bacterium]|nr:hypothetical protein [Caldilineaceae bacterium]
MKKLRKIQSYLRRRDLHGLAVESAHYLDWRFRTMFDLDIDTLGAYLDARIRYGIGTQTQHDEHVVLRRLLQKCSCRYLVDVGAHDGRSWSNSRDFMLRGWHG